VNAKRLLKLADHLDHGKLGHRQFDMDTWNSGYIDSRGCGTAGCAIGECPIVWPKLWRFQRLGPGAIPMIRTADVLRSGSAESSGQQFFDLRFHDFCHLFFSSHYPEFNYNPTSKQVARRIRTFVREKS